MFVTSSCKNDWNDCDETLYVGSWIPGTHIGWFYPITSTGSERYMCVQLSHIILLFSSSESVSINLQLQVESNSV